jgi:O-antigen/teichoic acid export membrane protein
MQLERQAAVALKWHTTAKLIGQVFAWAVTLIVLRLLDPEDYGLMAISTVIISVIAGTAEFGLGSALIQAQTLDRSQLARIAGALSALNLGCGLLLFMTAPLLANLFDEPMLTAVIRVSTLQFLLYAIEVVPQSLMQREMNFKGHASIEIASVITASTVTLVLAVLDAGVWALVIGNLAGGAVRTILLVTFGTFIMPSFRLVGIGEHVRFGGQVTAARFLWQFTYQLDTLIAARFLSGTAVGLYSVSMHLATLPVSKTMAIVNQVAFPTVARMQDDPERLRARLQDALRLLAFVAIPALWGLSAVAHEFVDVVLGAQWHEAILPLMMVSLVAPARMLMAVLGTAASAIGRADIELRNTVVGALILPVGFLIGVQGNLNGLAASWVVAIPLILALSLPKNCEVLGLSLRGIFTATRAPLLAGAALYVVVWWLRSVLIEFEEAVRLPLMIVAGGATYLLGVQIFDRGIWTDARRLMSALRG